MGGCPTITVPWAILFFGNALASTSTHVHRSADCCRVLKDAGLAHVITPSSPQYQQRVESYYSTSSWLTPECFVQPESTQDVSLIVSTLVEYTECKFAVRSGGHSPNAGWSNIEEGVTIDLSLLSGTLYDASTGLASVLPGTRWRDVYETLDSIGVGISGGRDGSVGAGGFLTGGGLSYYLYKYGMSCDMVRRFEVVLADGQILEASAEINADLFEALKGGGGSFGIVTRFDVETFETKPLRVVLLTHPESDGDLLTSAIRQWTDGLDNYQDNSAITLWSYQSSTDKIGIMTVLTDVSGKSEAPAFDTFLSIPGGDSTEISPTNMSQLATFEMPPGKWNIQISLTFKNDERIIAEAVALHKNLVDEVHRDSPGVDFETQCFFQPFPSLIGHHSISRGGNILGIDRQEDNSIVMQVLIIFDNPSIRFLAREKMLVLLSSLETFSRSVGGFVDYRYMNYADGSQDVMGSYGQDNIEKMLAVSRRYDPNRVFQDRVPGGFKLPESG